MLPTVKFGWADKEALNSATPLPPWVPPGWYPDPLGIGAARHWNGQHWSRDHRDAPSPQPIPVGPSGEAHGTPVSSQDTTRTMVGGGGRSCPRCGAQADRGRFCSVCGLNLSGTAHGVASQGSAASRPLADARRWYRRQSKGGKIAFLVSTALAILIIGGLIAHAVSGKSIDERVSAYLGYKVVGCHKVAISHALEEANGETTYECEGQFVTESASGSFSGG
jgi:Protein of unknown function (DUF2510)